MTITSIIIIFVILLIIELLYFKVADRFNIIDKPNSRSSHTSVTLRGGGIIFCFAGLLFYLISEFQYTFFFIGLISIATISFLDDVFTLNNKIRLSIHLIAVLLLFYQWGLFGLAWYWLTIIGVLIIGVINAYNFMDGINGMTGSYSAVIIITLYYINNNLVYYTNNDLLIIIGLSILVFNFFNFRKKAKCFAGDVGSVTMAFVVIFLLGLLIFRTGNFSYMLFLLIYGLDTVVTIAFRAYRKENIFKAHRSHFYQYLVNEKKISHVVVSSLYAVLQLLINILLLYKQTLSLIEFIIALILSSFLFITFRFATEGRNRLLQGG